MPIIVELNGRPGSGKTTLANLLAEELSPASVLLIDASPDQRLTLMLAPKHPELTLGELFSQKSEATGSREAIDWVFSDLTCHVGEENDLLTLGHLPEQIDPVELEKLRYGLTRLLEPYDYAVIDGYHALLHQLLPEDSVRTVFVVRPSDFTHWDLEYFSTLESSLHTPSLILNQYQNEPLPADLDEAIAQQQLQLVGKLPKYPTSEDCIRKLPDDFRNCLLRLDIPLNAPPSP